MELPAAAWVPLLAGRLLLSQRGSVADSGNDASGRLASFSLALAASDTGIHNACFCCCMAISLPGAQQRKR
jgi:hypothetical protein